MTDAFSAPPFNLDAETRAWVEATFARLSPEDRIRQLFVLRSFGSDAAELARQQAFRAGGVTRVMGSDLGAEQAILAAFDAAAPVPLTVSGDLEGSRMSLPVGTQFPNPLALAAVDDPEATRLVCRIMAEEARAAGFTWSLTPQIDINAAFRSAIVATRGYGSDPERIARHALIQIEEFQRAGIAATAKHFPGEGYDDRDQHLVTTLNPLTIEAWEESFGSLYRAAIGAGVMSVMSAHIAFPTFARAMGAGGIEAFRPASVNRLLNEDLLRGQLGFNGLVVSDATGMGGLTAWAPRAEYLPEVVASGCDVILFANDPEADAGYIRAALEDGRLTESRLEQAVRRILAFKAALGLHRPRSRDVGAARATPEKQAAVDAITRRAPTLVKDVDKLLPLRLERHRRILIVTPGIVPAIGPAAPFAVPDLLRRRGFEVTLFTPDMQIEPADHDLMLYLFGEETLLGRNHIFIDWMKLHGDLGKAMSRYWRDIPTAMVSFGYPYLLYDAPRVPCYINAWMTAEPMQQAVVDALMGEIAWNTHSPVDPFCGLEDARY